MLVYLVKTPLWLTKLFPKELIWKMPATDVPTVYITFDDGPHPAATPFVLAQLKEHNAKATFFCIGKNVVFYPDIYKEIVADGHATGNHTHNHLNGWKTETETYIKNIEEAAGHIDSKAFRPPYGKIKISQAKDMLHGAPAWNIYMWDVLSGDFDTDITPEQCLENVLNNIEPGAIIVFHDSEKAWERMSYALPHVLAYCNDKNWQMKALPQN